ncbi:MAG: DNA replication and repair protein RecF [Ignavibacteriales bacterium]|nr:DNA replication and repair protein RecF [Ignavibacteria bacterium]MCC6885305.1 DNA replication and repair protein RecF [Ignavibacteriales bacterium]
MILSKLRIVNFRNYPEQNFEFSSRFNFIYGDNGHGKTNILEAISFITFAKSFLGSSEADCLKYGEEFFTIKGLIGSETDNFSEVLLSYKPETRRNYFVNNQNVRNISTEIFGRYPVVFFSPHSLSITYGSPGERRRFFDILISQTSPVYLDDLRKLTRIIRQKNVLLKNYFNHHSDKSQTGGLLESYNDKLATVATSVIQRRLEFLSEFENFFKENFKMMVPDCSCGLISYKCESLPDLSDFSNADVQFREVLNYRLDEEIQRGSAITGPHRDDFDFKLLKGGETFDLKNHASQGEHKTFIAALKLAEYKFIQAKKDRNPIMLLDDILSELDINRVSNIIAHLKDFGQIFLTTTERKYLDQIGKFYSENEIKTIRVNNGEAKQE